MIYEYHFVDKSKKTNNKTLFTILNYRTPSLATTNYEQNIKTNYI